MIATKLRKFTFLFSLCLLGFFFCDVQAQTVREYATVDSLKVGDTFNYSITLDRNSQYDKINFPDSSDFGQSFEIRSRRQYQLSSYKDSLAYQLQFFATNDTTLPEMPVQLIAGQDTTVLYTNPIPIRFSSVLAEDEQSFRPLKPIFDFAAAWWPYILALLLLIAAAYFLYQYYWKEEETEEVEEEVSFTPSPFVNPIKELQSTINRLEKRELSSREEFKEFYIELGDAIRRYYEDLHSIPALESTSRELLSMLKDRAVDSDLVADTRAVLQEADMVKFAKFKPTSEQADRALQKAHNFLKRARDVDGPLVEHLRRRHHSRVEKERERFKNKQQKQEVEA